MKVELTNKEAEIVVTQLVCRKQDFDDMMVEAASKKNTNRIREIMEIADTLQSVVDKPLNAGATMTM